MTAFHYTNNFNEEEWKEMDIEQKLEALKEYNDYLEKCIKKLDRRTKTYF